MVKLQLDQAYSTSILDIKPETPLIWDQASILIEVYSADRCFFQVDAILANSLVFQYAGEFSKIYEG